MAWSPRMAADLLPETHSPRLRGLIHEARKANRVPLAIVWPLDGPSLRAALDAARLGLIEPVLCGSRNRLQTLAASEGIDLSPAELVDASSSGEAAAAAVDCAVRGRVAAIMKGTAHTDEVMHAVVAAPQLHTARRMSHVMVADVATYHKLMFITDAAVNIAPDLEAKRDIVQNAIDLAVKVGVETPKVAILAAVETVSPHLPATVDAASLCKMADRRQITGGILDGPLAFDDAISRTAADGKAIVSAVAGDADIFVVPDLEAGNMLFKELEYVAGAECAGVVAGARIPIVLTGRADGEFSRIASIALGVLSCGTRA
ncbi:MAG: bifunctional enoyl-CoA hydratase/phosphate acetyltransferase [Candidatus Eremiobacteraeota bacterium]|nr:bifunctional enoyl-CoA hydratase/phosphate acetyltransferase [Candidatus Eremiobacteraeota bacterium]